MSEKATMEAERPTSIAFLIFLIFLIGGSFIIAAIPLKGLLVWFIGMALGFLFGLLVSIEIQTDRERHRERATTNQVG